MTDLAGIHSYFWLTSSRLRKPLQDDVPYTAQALRQDLARVRNAWDGCQSNRERDAIYSYLTAVFDLVVWWAAEKRALARARKALRLQNIWPSDHDEPFAAIIRCTADPAKVDKRTRSKWSRVMRYATEYKPALSPWPRSFSARVASTSVLRGLRVALGEVVRTSVELYQAWMR